MTLLHFPNRTGDWQRGEMNALMAACGEPLDKGTISGWEIGATERGEPQLYLLGPAPDHDCILCVSRIGRTYVVEDGEGRVLCEHDAVGSLTDRVRHALRHKKTAIVARVTMVWFAVKGAFEERFEALTEPLEVLEHVAPQLVAMI